MGFIYEDEHSFEESHILCVLGKMCNMTSRCIELLSGDNYMAENNNKSSKQEGVVDCLPANSENEISSFHAQFSAACPKSFQHHMVFHLLSLKEFNFQCNLDDIK
jgi:hypothetical protein